MVLFNIAIRKQGQVQD